MSCFPWASAKYFSFHFSCFHKQKTTRQTGGEDHVFFLLSCDSSVHVVIFLFVLGKGFSLPFLHLSLRKKYTSQSVTVTLLYLRVFFWSDMKLVSFSSRKFEKKGPVNRSFPMNKKKYCNIKLNIFFKSHTSSCSSYALCYAFTVGWNKKREEYIIQQTRFLLLFCSCSVCTHHIHFYSTGGKRSSRSVAAVFVIFFKENRKGSFLFSPWAYTTTHVAL